MRAESSLCTYAKALLLLLWQVSPARALTSGDGCFTPAGQGKVELPPLWEEAAPLWSRYALVGSEQVPLLSCGLHVVLVLMGSPISVDSLSFLGVWRSGSCFSLLVGARTRALLSEKHVESAPGWMQLPWQMLVPLSRPQGLIRAAQAVLPTFGKWGYTG